MSVKLSRRDVLRGAGWGALALSQARLFTACSSGGDAASQQPTFAFDPDMPWWMQGPFAPEPVEHDALRLSVTGKIPVELEGTYVRNGPNPTRGQDHWFRGEGMLHGVRLEGGAARWYRNRWVKTPLIGAGPDEMFNPVLRPEANPSNVSLVRHAGKLLSLGEAGLPYEISAADLSTIGPYDFAGRLKTFMTAHPKLDPRTGDMHMFGYGFVEPYLTYHRVNAAGELVQSEPIALPRAVLMHDFHITQSKVVFMDLPVVFDLALGAAGAFPFRWDASNGARIGLMPHGGGNASVTWFEIEPCFIFHGFNAYDDAAGNVVLDVCRFPHLWVEQSTDFDAASQLYRYTLDPVAKTATLEQLDDRNLDFPSIDPRLVGADYRYGYGLCFDTFDFGKGPMAAGMAKYDRQRDSLLVREFAPFITSSEPLFVPAAPDAAEDEGFLLSFQSDLRTQRGSLEIFDARDLRAPAVASVKLPWRVPIGIHGIWIPG